MVEHDRALVAGTGSDEKRAAYQTMLDDAEKKLSTCESAADAAQKSEADAQDETIKITAKWRAELAGLQAMPKAWATFYGAKACAADNKKRDAIAEIAAEKRTARESGGGVVDMQNIYAWQEDVAVANRERAEAIAAAKQRKVKPAKCSDPFTQRLATCMGLTPIIEDMTRHLVRYEEDNPKCAELQVQEFLSLDGE